MIDTTNWTIVKRNGEVVPFDTQRIFVAIRKAFLATGAADTTCDSLLPEIVSDVLQSLHSVGQPCTVEQVQDRVELQLMHSGHYHAARHYIVYRAEHAKIRALQSDSLAVLTSARPLMVKLPDGGHAPFDLAYVQKKFQDACAALPDCDPDGLVEDVIKSIYDGITQAELRRALVLAPRARMEQDPAYDQVAARLMLEVVYHDALGRVPEPAAFTSTYRRQFVNCIYDGIEAGRLSPDMQNFDLLRLAGALQPERDALLQYLGVQTLYDRYLLHVEGRRLETPQYFWMRVAMGLALQEGPQREARAIKFYEVLSTLRFTSATPTLFNSGTLHPQLSSCYLSTTSDNLEHIFKVVSDNAKLSKWAGGLGNDWTNVRAEGARIHGTNGKSQGLIPFLKVVNSTAVAVDQGGKRKGAVCAYLETWHLDIEDFLDLRKNTGDERRRAHDMNTANWIPDLFMKRVQANQDWTLFSPDQVPDLHDLVGQVFDIRYAEYEAQAAAGTLPGAKTVSASALWQKMLTRLFETGHPWITWKDPSNIRSPQDHCGVVHSSNLCTEILLNTSETETAVCNLGSVNLKAHIVNGALDLHLLQQTVSTAMRMLDNVVDINFYPTPEAATANLQHRPVGLGLMGFQDALTALGVGYDWPEAATFADTSMEAISYFAILASTKLARERGAYPSYAGSKWDRGLLPIDTIDLLEQERGQKVDVDRKGTLDWKIVRAAIEQHGMRNSNCLAIAPTATISTIVGVSQSIEPTYKHLYVKSNLSGEFTQVNADLVAELKRADLWDADMLAALKHYDGVLAEIPRIPDEIKQRYLTAFELDPYCLLECAARRQKWLDMGQSLNLYMSAPSGRKLSAMYFAAWEKGLKTTYYLRTLAATQVEKSTIDVNKFGIQPRWMKNKSTSGDIQVTRDIQLPATDVAVCRLDNPDCESCQ